MTYTAIMSVEDGRVAKFRDFAVEAEAQTHVAAYAAAWPQAYVVETLAAPISDWLCDPAAGTAIDSPPPPLYPSRADMAAEIDQAAEQAMVALTQSAVGPMKTLVFNGRLTEAEAYGADPDPDAARYPFLSALIGTDYGADLSSVAAAILAEQAQMSAALAAVDAQGVAGKAAVSAAADAAAAAAARDAALAAIASVLASLQSV